jgi:4-amino-4-deoxy-L-arabinose transferase-like glycosyltransferase
MTRWLAGLILILLVGLIFLGTGYDAGLPLYESKDERHNLDEVYTLRGLHADALWKPGYPPGILYINYGAQILAEAVTGESAWDCPCTVIRSVRLAGLLANLLTALLIALTARQLAGDAAGWLAALAWLIAPRVLAQNQFGFPQVYEGLLYMAALYTALRALKKRQPRDALLSVAAGLGAVLFKYTVFPVLGLGVGVSLWHLRTNRQRWTRVLIVQVAAVGLTALALFTLGGASSLIDSGHVEANQFVDSGLLNVFNLNTHQVIFSNAAGQIGLAGWLFGLLLLAGSVFYWRQATTWQRLGWLGTVGLGLSHLIVLAAYLVYDEGIDRNLLSSSSVLAVMVAVASVSLVRVVSMPRVRAVVLTLVALIWLGPQAVAAWEWVTYRRLPVTYAALAQWANETLPEEAMLVNDWRPFTREWSCYPQAERWAIMDEHLLDYRLEDWFERDVYYAQFTREQVADLQATAEGQAYMDRMTLLKQFPEPGDEAHWRSWRRGYEPYLMVYRLWSPEPQFTSETVFGATIRLLGYDFDQNVDTLRLRFYWQSVQPPPRDYSVFIHLTPADSPTPVLAQADGVPSRSNFRATTTWRDRDEVFMSRDFLIDLPADLPDGDYALRVGLYDWQTSARLMTAGDADALTIPLAD